MVPQSPIDHMPSETGCWTVLSLNQTSSNSMRDAAANHTHRRVLQASLEFRGRSVTARGASKGRCPRVVLRMPPRASDPCSRRGLPLVFPRQLLVHPHRQEGIILELLFGKSDPIIAANSNAE